MNIPFMNMMSQEEFCEHIEDDDFFLKYGNPVAISAEDGNIVVCMAIEYYERISGKKVIIEDGEEK